MYDFFTEIHKLIAFRQIPVNCPAREQSLQITGSDNSFQTGLSRNKILGADKVFPRIRLPKFGGSSGELFGV